MHGYTEARFLQDLQPVVRVTSFEGKVTKAIAELLEKLKGCLIVPKVELSQLQDVQTTIPLGHTLIHVFEREVRVLTINIVVNIQRQAFESSQAVP